MAHLTTTPLNFGKINKTLGLSALGGALEVFDFVIFVFLADVIQQVFFPPQMPYWLSLLQTFAIFSAGYLARPFGGILMARYADKFGRKKAFTITILMMSMPCFLTSLMPSYQQIGYFAPLLLLLFRIIQGAAVGGEVPSAWVFVYEHAPKSYVGLVLGSLQAGLTIGYLLGAIVGAIIFKVFDELALISYGWRIPFFVGGICGLISIFMRLRLDETPVFLAMQKNRAVNPVLSLHQVISRSKSLIIPAMLISCVLTSAIVVLVMVTPTVMKQYYGVTMQQSLVISSLGIMALNIGCVVAGAIADRIGVWRAFYYYSIALFVGFSIFYLLMPYNLVCKAIGAIFAGICCGVVALVPTIMVRLFPPENRVTGISVTYNLAYSIWAGISPPLLISLTIISSLFAITYILLASIIGIIIYKINQQLTTHDV